MKVDFYSIGSEVYFINDKQKVDCGYITGIEYEAKRISNSDGYSTPILETAEYTIDGKYRRDGKFIFKTRDELINSL